MSHAYCTLHNYYFRIESDCPHCMANSQQNQVQQAAHNQQQGVNTTQHSPYNVSAGGFGSAGGSLSTRTQLDKIEEMLMKILENLSGIK